MSKVHPKRFEDKIRKPRVKPWKVAMSLQPGQGMIDLLLLPNPPERVLAMLDAWKFKGKVEEKSVESEGWDVFSEPDPIQEEDAPLLGRISVKSINRIIREIKDECMRCGETFKPALDFHHRDPLSKLFEISNFCSKENVRKKRTLQELYDEISKCDVLCATCHRKEHGGFFSGNS